MVKILALVSHYDEHAMLTAAELVLGAGVASKTRILNLLHLLLNGKPVASAPVSFHLEAESWLGNLSTPRNRNFTNQAGQNSMETWVGLVQRPTGLDFQKLTRAALRSRIHRWRKRILVITGFGASLASTLSSCGANAASNHER